jgi:hypothetical protein
VKRLLLLLTSLALVLASCGGTNEPEVRVQLWCEGHAQGIAAVLVQTGYAPPYENEFQEMVESCKSAKTYLEVYTVQPGIAPPPARTGILEDEGLTPPGGGGPPSQPR